MSDGDAAALLGTMPTATIPIKSTKLASSISPSDGRKEMRKPLATSGRRSIHLTPVNTHQWTAGRHKQETGFQQTLIE